MRQKALLIKIVILIILFSFSGCKEQLESERKKRRINVPWIKKEKRLSEKQIKKKAEIFDAYFCDLQQKRGMNGTVLVAKGTQVILKKGYGYKDYKTKEPLPINSVFQLASVSKQFTAAAIMLLKQRGLLRYEDTVQRFYPDFPYHGITIRQLLTHNSGLSNYTYFCDKVWNRKKTIDNENVICLMIEHTPAPYFRPGLRYDYSNTGYMILASIVEKASKMKFDYFMKTQIFEPLNMKNSYIYNHGSPIVIAGEVEGFNYGRRKVGKTYLDGVFGDKGVYSTVEDLYKWDRALHSEKVLCKETIVEAFMPGYEKMRGERDNYGFGWRIKDYKGDKVVWHGGWWEGFKTMFIRNLKDEVVIVVLTNSLAGHLKADELLDIYYN